MELLPLLYTHKLYHFNISDDSNYITFKGGAPLYLGNLANNTLYTLKKNNSSYDSSFSVDKSFVVIKSDSSCFWVNENFQKKSLVRYPTKNYTLGFEKPLVYKDSFFTFCKNYLENDETETELYKHTESKKEIIFSIKEVYLVDNKIYEDVLYAVFNNYERDKVFVYTRNLQTPEEKLFEFSVDNKDYLRMISIPQKKQMVVLIDRKEASLHNVSLQFRKLESFELIHEEYICSSVFGISPSSADITTMCWGQYVVIAHKSVGLLIYNTDNFSLEKKVYFPMANELTVCDNEDFCCAYSLYPFGDMVVFTPIISKENRKLIKRLENFFDSNGLGKMVIKK